MGVCNRSMFCRTLLYVHSSIAIILMGKRELVALLNLSSWCLMMVVWLFFAVPWVCLRLVNVLFPDHTHLLFLSCPIYRLYSINGNETDGSDQTLLMGKLINTINIVIRTRHQLVV